MTAKKIGPRIENVFGLFLFVTFLAGCAVFDQTILIPEENGIYHAIALDSTDFGAERNALKRAEKTCSGRENMRYVVDSQQLLYRGTAVSTGQMSTLNDKNSAARQTIPGKTSAEDYKAVVTFHCAVG